MKRYKRAFLRHKLLVIAPLVVALVFGVGFELRQPHQYLAQGTLWADAPVPDNSTVFSFSQQPGGSAAAQGASLLQELLHTNSFLVTIGQHSPWATYLREHPGSVPTVLGSVPKDASVTVVGPQVMSVGFMSNDAATSTVLDKAIMDAFVGEVVALQQVRDKQQIAYDKQSLQKAGQALSAAQQQLASHLAAHPQAPGTTVDPTVTQLSGTVATAEQAYGSAVSDANGAQLSLSHASDSGELHVLDPPGPAAAQARKKKIVYAAVGGLFAGAVISVLLLSWLVSNDTSLRDAEDVEEALGLSVVASIEQDRSSGRRPTRVS
jgi:uncharacterized protein involved in exopolysaccharide biosynthesis